MGEAYQEGMGSRMIKVRWIDGGRSATQPANPQFPDGFNLDISKGSERSCTARLPYPAARCGIWEIEFDACQLKAMVTAAGRADDPRSLRIACRVPLQ